jgi:hypothetical protein
LHGKGADEQMFWWGFVIGLIAGANLGVLVAAMFFSSRRHEFRDDAAALQQTVNPPPAGDDRQFPHGPPVHRSPRASGDASRENGS